MDFSKVKSSKTKRKPTQNETQTKGFMDAVKGANKKETLPQVKDPYDLTAAQAKFAYVTAELAKMKKTAAAIIVKDAASLEKAVSCTGQAKRLFKKIEAERKALGEKPRKFLASLKNFCDKFTVPLKTIEDDLSRKVGDYQYNKQLADKKTEKAQAKARAKLQEAINKEAKGAGVPAPVMAPAAPLPQTSTVARADDGTSAYIKRPWIYEITDESAVPAKYCVPNPPKIKAAIKAGIREIPGLRIFQETKTSFRT